MASPRPSVPAQQNTPISRFLDWLQQSGNLEAYMQKLVQAFNPSAIAGLMCRNTLSVGWDGRLYDCDFNQMLDLEIVLPEGPHTSKFDRQLHADGLLDHPRASAEGWFLTGACVADARP